MPLHLIRTDITTLRVDAIVNAANEQLRPGGGVCGAIFDAAGLPQLEQACRAIGHCSTGSAVITPGFRLPARYVLHTPGPVWHGGSHGEEKALTSCYRSCLTLAAQHELTSIAFPLISSGVYGYPAQEAIRVAVRTIRDYLADEAHEDLDVYLVLYSRESYAAGSDLYGGIRSYITDAQVKPDLRRRIGHNQSMNPMSCAAKPAQDARRSAEKQVSAKQVTSDEDAYLCTEAMPMTAPSAAPMDEDDEAELKAWLQDRHNHGVTFTEYLFQLISRTGETDAAIYRRANLDRRLFSKIRSSAAYQPSKSTVLALCMALRLDRSEAGTLLSRAGYALTDANPRDLAVIWCLDHKRWDVIDLNMVLFDMDLPMLGA